MGDEVKQYFTWISPNSSANYSYIIKYDNAANVTSPNGTSVMTKNITVTNITHTYTKTVSFTVPTSRVIYNFWIAANSSAGMGEYSDRVQITYDGKSDVLKFNKQSLIFTVNSMSSLLMQFLRHQVLFHSQISHATV